MRPKSFFLFTVGALGLVFLLMSSVAWGQTDPYWRLWYPQVVNGVSGGNTYVTTLVVSNPSSIGIEVALEDHDHNNPDNWMQATYTSNCQVDGTHFYIPAFASCRLDTDGRVAFESGWLEIYEVQNTHNLGGYLTYTYYQGNPLTGIPVFTVGVSPTPACGRFSVPVLRDSSTLEDTAFAVVNPNTYQVNIRADLYSTTGLVDTRSISLYPKGHVAQFMSELFPGALGSATKFVGNVLFSGLSSNDSAVVTVLLQRQNQYGGATATLQDISYSKTVSVSAAGSLRTTPPPAGKLVSTAASPLF